MAAAAVELAASRSCEVAASSSALRRYRMVRRRAQVAVVRAALRSLRRREAAAFHRFALQSARSSELMTNADRRSPLTLVSHSRRRRRRWRWRRRRLRIFSLDWRRRHLIAAAIDVLRARERRRRAQRDEPHNDAHQRCERKIERPRCGCKNLNCKTKNKQKKKHNAAFAGF